MPRRWLKTLSRRCIRLYHLRLNYLLDKYPIRVCAAIFLVGLALTVIGHHHENNRTSILLEGIKTYAEVIRIHDNYNSYSREVTYEFHDAVLNRTVNDRQTVAGRNRSSIRRGDHVNIRYVPGANPPKSLISSAEIGQALPGLSKLFGMALLISSLIIFALITRHRQI